MAKSNRFSIRLAANVDLFSSRPHGKIKSIFYSPHGECQFVFLLPCLRMAIRCHRAERWHPHFACARPFAAIALSTGVFPFCSHLAIRCHRAERWQSHFARAWPFAAVAPGAGAFPFRLLSYLALEEFSHCAEAICCHCDEALPAICPSNHAPPLLGVSPRMSGHTLALLDNPNKFRNTLLSEGRLSSWY